MIYFIHDPLPSNVKNSIIIYFNID